MTVLKASKEAPSIESVQRVWERTVNKLDAIESSRYEGERFGAGEIEGKLEDFGRA